MKVKKIPMRTCVITKEKYEKRDLIRIVRTPEGNVEIDITGKLNGRGAYIKKDMEVVNKARKSRVLDRVLDAIVPDSIYERIIELINE